MTKKKIWTFIVSGIIFLSSAIIYLQYFSKPTSFPSNEQLIEEIHSTISINELLIQDTIPVDDRHVFVPFISNNKDYGLSYWIWQKNKWRMASIDTKGQPMLWKVDKHDPSSFKLVWNIHPNDQLRSLHFYLIRDRGFSISEEMENYSPRVQMVKEVHLKETSYGLIELPDEWVTIMNSLIKVESTTQTNLLFNNFSPEQNIFFGWIPYNHAGQESFPELSVNGDGYSNGTVDLEHMLILEKEDIELPSVQY